MPMFRGLGKHDLYLQIWKLFGFLIRNGLGDATFLDTPRKLVPELSVCEWRGQDMKHRTPDRRTGGL